MRALRPRRASGEAGATMVEFALVSIVAFLLMLSAAELAMVVLGKSTGSNAARDGARVGLIYYRDADISSTNNTKVVTAVQQHLAGNVRNLTVAVRCLRGDTLAQLTACNPTYVDLTRGDLIEVLARWDHKGFGPFMPTLSQSSTARMVIGGEPDLTTATTATTTTTTTTASTTTTTTGPAKNTISSLLMKDVDADGRVDRVEATFSGGAMAFPSACNTGWSLANVPSGGTLNSVSVSGSVVTLSINEGPGAQDTAVGSFTVTFTPPSGACANGANGFTTSPTDAAGPVPISMSDVASGATDGKPEAGDAYRVTFSETVSPTWSSGSSVDVVLTRGGSPSDTTYIQIPNLAAASFNTGGKYNAVSTTVTFSASTLTASGANLTVTLGSCTSGCSSTLQDKGAFTYTPSATIRDLAGNVPAGTLSSGNNYFLF